MYKRLYILKVYVMMSHELYTDIDTLNWFNGTNMLNCIH